MYKNIILHILKEQAVMAEWLRRLTRNQIPYGIAGSNPAGCVLFCNMDFLVSYYEQAVEYVVCRLNIESLLVLHKWREWSL